MSHWFWLVLLALVVAGRTWLGAAFDLWFRVAVRVPPNDRT
jgi:hypothetical protein